MMMSIEQHVEWIAAAIDHVRAAGATTFEATSEAAATWTTHVNDVGDRTLFKYANSWYVGANIPGKPRVFMPYAGGHHVYRDECDDVAADGYRGFVTL